MSEECIRMMHKIESLEVTPSARVIGSAPAHECASLSLAVAR